MNNRVLWGYDCAVIDNVRYALKDGEAIVIAQQKNIVTATIPSAFVYNDVTYSVTSIGPAAFYGCSALTSVTIPDSITSIDHGAFDDCISLMSLVIPSSVTSIKSAFVNCRQLTIYCEAIEQPSGYEAYWNNWYLYCSRPEDMQFCAVVWDCKNNDVDENGYVYIVTNGIRYALKDGEAIVTVQSVNIDTAIILSAVEFKNVTYTVTRIDSIAFYDCLELISVTIPDSIKSIMYSAFWGCNKLTSITYVGTVEQWNAIFSGGIGDIVCTVHCTDGNVALYK